MPLHGWADLGRHDSVPLCAHCFLHLSSHIRSVTASRSFPALAKLPESSRPEEAFALTRVVSGQNTENCVLVAHDESGAGKRLVGFMVLTSEVDPGVLLEAFDLHPYDNFLPEEEYERQSAEARESVRVKKVSSLLCADVHRQSCDDAGGGSEVAGCCEAVPILAKLHPCLPILPLP